MKTTIQLISIVSLMTILQPAHSQIGNWDPNLENKADETIEEFISCKPKISDFVESAHAYAVFPLIGKGGAGFGGAHGRGIVKKDSTKLGEAKMTQITVGLQWGGQVYSELVFFQDSATFADFKRGELKLAGQASAVAINAGASTNLAYSNGIAIFTKPRGGLMYEASVGGQKFTFIETEQTSSASNQ